MPKIIIITQGVSRIVKPVIDASNVIGIIESPPRKLNSILKYKIVEFLKIIYSIVTAKELSLRWLAFKNKIPYCFMTSNDILEEWIRKKNPDLIIIYSMSQLLSEKIFNLPKYNTINLHPSYLPKYRGPNPWFWQYYYMEEKGGVTLHYIDKGEDTGDIIYQKMYDIPLGIKSPDIHDIAIGDVGIRLILKAISNIDNLPRKKQPKVSPTSRARNIDIYEHKTIIKWEEWPIERIWHILRGTEQWLNALEQPKGLYAGQRWSVLSYQKLSMDKYEIAKIYKENNKQFVACKDGKIFLELKFSLLTLILKIIRG